MRIPIEYSWRAVAAVAVAACFAAGLSQWPAHGEENEAADELQFSSPFHLSDGEDEPKPSTSRERTPSRLLDPSLSAGPSRSSGSLSPVQGGAMPPQPRQFVPTRQFLEEIDRRRNWMFAGSEGDRQELSTEEAFGVRRPSATEDARYRTLFERYMNQGSRSETPAPQRQRIHDWSDGGEVDAFSRGRGSSLEPATSPVFESMAPGRNRSGTAASPFSPSRLGAASPQEFDSSLGNAFPSSRLDPLGGLVEGRRPNHNQAGPELFPRLGSSGGRFDGSRPYDPINAYTQDQTSRPATPIAPMEGPSATQGSAFSGSWGSPSASSLAPRTSTELDRRPTGSARIPAASHSSEPSRSLFQPLVPPPPTRQF